MYLQSAMRIDQDKLVQLTKNLVEIPSPVTMIDGGNENEIVCFLADRLKRIGLEVRLQEVVKGRSNIIGIIQGRGGGYNLMLNGHLDTVETGGMKIDPFRVKITNKKIFGRGTADMKGAIAAMVMVCEIIQKSGIDLRGDLIFSGTIDEEGRGLGGEYLAKSDLNVDMSIVGEPTGLALGIAHKGLTFINIIVEGKAAHGSSPEYGTNAILVMNRIINRLNTQYYRELNKKKHPILGKPTFNIGLIKGGHQPNIVPDHCMMSIDRRMIPGENYSTVINEIKEITKEEQEEDPVIKIRCEALNWVKCLPMEIKANEQLVETVKKNLKNITRANPPIIGLPYWTDASSFVNIMKIPSLVFGPGDLAQAHSAMESIQINKLMTFARTILASALDICTCERAQN